MLQKLYIRNYAIIDELNIQFDEHLNVITGETGAGKSIILGALSLILGERADTSVLINREEKSVVEATFLTENNRMFEALLSREELDIDRHTIIRREISASGKSRAFINDTPVTLSVLNELTSALVDLHRQFDTRALEQQSFAFNVVDAIADNQNLISEFQNEFRSFKQLQASHKKFKEEAARWQTEADYKQFLFDELDKAELQPNEIELSETKLKQLSHSEQIRTALQSVYFGLEESDQPINNELKRLLQILQGVAQVQPEIDSLAARLQSALLELKDIADESNSLYQKVELDPETIASLQERVDLGYRLLKKHNVGDTDSLLHIREELGKTLTEQSNSTEQLEKMERQLQLQEDKLVSDAIQIRERRTKNVGNFAENVNKLLKQVGMPNAKFKISIESATRLTEYGMDEIVMLIDANKSGQWQAIQKAASGGELSRIMLSIKTLTAEALSLPTLIFDEVDTGISGEAAKQVAVLLQTLGRYHQVICITHQPQVAAKGSSHYFVYKHGDDQDKIKTRIRILEHDERVSAVAQMIGGTDPSEAALESARELMTVQAAD